MAFDGSVNGGQRLPAVREGPIPLERRPTVTVVIPCYNYARYLRESVSSALGQSEVDVDVVIVDDASTDDSQAVAQELAQRDPRVTVLAHHRNLGPVQTFNAGLARASGEFVARLDADDLLTNGSLGRAAAVMTRHPEVGLVYGHPIHFATESARPRARTEPSGWLIWRGRHWLEARCRDATNVITSPEALFRRSLTERVGGQRELGHTHDLEMWLRLAAHSDVAYIEGVDQAWHREHSASLSQRAQDPLVILPEIRRAFDTLFSGDGARIDSAERLNRLAHTALAADAVDRAVRVLKSGSPRSEAGELLDFASDCLPDARSWSDYVWADERVADRPRSRFDRARLWLLPRRVKGWFRNRARARRWRRTGVYERLEIGSPR